MSRALVGVLYALAMIATVVLVDLLFLRDHTGLRLLVNIAIVAAFGIVYLLVFRRGSRR